MALEQEYWSYETRTRALEQVQWNKETETNAEEQGDCTGTSAPTGTSALEQVDWKEGTRKRHLDGVAHDQHWKEKQKRGR